MSHYLPPNNVCEVKKPTRWFLLAGLTISFFLVFFVSFVMLPLYLGIENFHERNALSNILVSTLAQALTILTIWLLTGKPFRSLFKTYPPTKKAITVSILVGFTTSTILFLLSLLTFSTVFPINTDAVSLQKGIGDLQKISPLLPFIMPVLVAIVEEFFFRGILYNFLFRGFEKLGTVSGFWFATIISATLFGVTHSYQLNIEGAAVFLTTVLFGILATFLYQKFDTIWAPIIAHSFYAETIILIGLMSL